MAKLMGVDFYRLIPTAPPWDQSPLFYYNLLDFIKNTEKVNAIRILTLANMPFGYFDTTYPNAKLWYQRACSEARAKGIKIMLVCFADEVNSDAYKADVILNVNGAGDRWITNFAQIIADCQPDAIEVMNEPPSVDGSGNPNLTFTAYRAFIVRACQEFRARKPDISLFVGGCPYWNLGDWGSGSWVTMPLTEFIDVTYTYHLYYDEFTLGWDWAQAYQIGDLANAKTLLYNFILNVANVKPLIDAGLTISIDEVGADNAYPNWDAYLKDMYAFIATYNMGLIQHGLAPNPPEKYGILTSDWTELNEVGLLWKQEAIPPTPTISIVPPLILGCASGLVYLIWRTTKT